MFKYLLMFLLCIPIAHAAGISHEPKWVHAHNVPNDVRISYRKMTPTELRVKEAELFGGDVHDQTQAFAHVQKNTLTGEYFCTIYYTVGIGSSSMVMAHERRHCHGWTHE